MSRLQHNQSTSPSPSHPVVALWRGGLGLLPAALIALFVILPLLQPGLPATADTPIHFYRALEFSRSWGPGVVYPRWAPDLAYGYGYPLWVFAPPLPYVIPLLLTAIGAPPEIGLKGLIILAALIYALGAYLFARQHLGSRAGLISAAIYTLAPFALREVLLYGGNYPQYLAIGLYPWVLWGLSRIRRRASWANILLTAILYGAVMLSHLFHVLILTPVAAAYALVLTIHPPPLKEGPGEGEKPVGKSSYGKINPFPAGNAPPPILPQGIIPIVNLPASALAMALGLLGTAFFWLPAFFERAFTRSTDDVYLSVSPIFSRFLNWGELLAWPHSLDARAANPWVPLSLGVGALFLALPGAMALLWPAKTPRFNAISKKQSAPPAPQRGEKSKLRETHLSAAHSKKSVRLQGLFFLLLLAIVVFMMLPASTWIWTTVPLLAVAEFPWRLLGLANLSLAFLGGASVLLFTGGETGNGRNLPEKSPSLPGPPAPRLPRSWPQNLFTLAAVVIVLLASGVYLYPPRPFEHYDDSLSGMGVYEMTTRTIGTTTLGEYLPVWVKDAPVSSPVVEGLIRNRPVEKLDRSNLPQATSAQRLEHTAVSDVYHFDSPTPFQARFYTFYYPGWTAALDEQPVDIAIEPESGLITVPIPAGAHTLHLAFKDTPLRIAANLVSLGTVIILFLALAKFAIRKFRSTDERRPAAQIERGASKICSSLSSCGLFGGALIALLLLKGLLIDPHTGWFRQQSPPGQVAGAQHPLQIKLNDQFQLLGYDVSRNTLSPGQTARVVLYWQALRPAETDYRSFVHLDSPVDQQTWAISDNFHPGDATAQIDIPTSSWDTTHYIRDEHFLQIPRYAPPVTFNLRAGLYNPYTGQRIPLNDGTGDAIPLQPIQIIPEGGIFKPQIDIPNPVEYRLGDHIELLGYHWDESQAALTLFWQSNQALPNDYVVFVHWLNDSGQLVRGADGPPLGGLYPTSAWHPHTPVVDIRPLDPGDLPPGKYTLAVGLYHPDTLARLPVTDARGQPAPDNVIRLTIVQINDG